jgi:hypothetical protein
MGIGPVQEGEHSGMPEKAVDEMCLTSDRASCADQPRHPLNRSKRGPELLSAEMRCIPHLGLATGTHADDNASILIARLHLAAAIMLFWTAAKLLGSRLWTDVSLRSSEQFVTDHELPDC